MWNFDTRWVIVKNTASEWIPAFACVEIADLVEYAGAVCYEVKKPTSTIESSQNPRLVLFNGSQPIPPSSNPMPYGRGTFDWPCLALHDGVNDQSGGSDAATAGSSVGPKSGSWYLWSDYDGFVVQGHDPTYAYDSNASHSQEGGVHTILVAPGSAADSSEPFFAVVVDDGTTIGITETVLDLSEIELSGFTLASDELTSSIAMDRIRMTITLHCLWSAASGDQGVQFKLYQRETGGTLNTLWTGLFESGFSSNCSGHFMAVLDYPFEINADDDFYLVGGKTGTLKTHGVSIRTGTFIGERLR